MYGEDVDSATVRNSETGLQKFRSGNFDVDDAPRFGRAGFFNLW